MPRQLSSGGRDARPHRALGARRGRSLLRLALAGRGIRVVRRAGGDPAVVVRRDGDARDGELCVRLAARRDLHVEFSVAADRDITTCGQRSGLDRPGRPGCRRAVAVLVHGPRWGGTGPNGIGSGSGFNADDHHAVRVGGALCSTDVPCREPRCSSRARGLDRHRCVRPSAAPGIRGVRVGRSAAHRGAGNRVGAQPCPSAPAADRRPSRACARGARPGSPCARRHVGRGRSSPW